MCVLIHLFNPVPHFTLAASIQREGLIEPIVVRPKRDHYELIAGERPADRVKTMLGKLDSARRSKELGYKVAIQASLTSHKFVGSVEKILKNLPKPLEWRSFLNNDLPLLVDICREVQEASTQNRLCMWMGASLI